MTEAQEALITSDPAVMVGKPVIRGTRITVELILEKLAYGQTIPDILEDYPHLTEEGIKAAIAFAADVMSHHRASPDKKPAA